MARISHLDHSDYERFLEILDPLGFYVNEQLGITERMASGFDEGMSIDEYEQHLVFEQLWSNKYLIDEYIALNPDHMRYDELGILSLWKYAIDASFYATEHNGKVLLYSDGFAFEVYGLTDGIGYEIGHMPAFVKCALLPFEGKIIYDGFFVPLESRFLPQSESEAFAGFKDAVKQGRVIRTADELIDAYPLIQKNREDAEATAAMASLELEMDPTLQFAGFHRSPLADMSDEERKEAIKAASDADIRTRIPKTLEVSSSKEPADHTLASFLYSEKKRQLLSFCEGFELTGMRSLNKTQISQRLAEEVIARDDFMIALLSSFSLEQVRALHNLAKAGGAIRVKASELDTLDGLPMPTRPFGYLCPVEGSSDEYTFYMPEDMVESFLALDFDKVEHQVKLNLSAILYTDALVYMRGIVTVSEAYQMYHKAYPLGLMYNDYTDRINFACSQRTMCYELLLTGTENYLIHYTLGDDHREEFNAPHDLPFVFGPESSLMLSFMEARDGKPPRELPEGIENYEDLMNYYLDQPGVKAVEDFLYAHVPDGADDTFFVDTTITALIDIMRFGHDQHSESEYFDVLATRGFMAPKQYRPKIAGLLDNMSRCIPNWMDNGWSYYELLEQKTGRKLFFNERGQAMKIGADDPCPCGSGKRYRDCHGK